MENQIFKLKKFINKLELNDNNLDKRSSSFNNFYKSGFPSKKLEDWKFIDLNQIISAKIPNLDFFNELVISEVNYSKYLEKLQINLKDYNYIIYANGFIKKIVLEHEIENKIKISRNFNNLSSIKNDSLGNLNDALHFDYIKIEISENYEFNKPLIIFNILDDKIGDTNFNIKFDITLGNNSQLSILDFNLNYNKNNLININNNYLLHEGSILKNYKINIVDNKNLIYSKTNIDLEKNSVSENFILTSGSEFSKNEIVCNLKGNYSSAFINGIMKLNDSKKHEIRSKINHLCENTKSYQLVKSTLEDEAKSVYQGKIFVDKIAQKTDGYQLSKAILLNEATEFNGKPELEIYADDVKCSHGSTSGNLDENKIFYLMTRGLNQKEAKKLLLDGFFLEIIEKITDLKVKEEIKNLMDIS